MANLERLARALGELRVALRGKGEAADLMLLEYTELADERKRAGED